AIPSPPADLKVTRNGVEMPIAVLGDPLPIDPGAVQIVAEAPGFRRETRSVVAKEGQVAELEIRLEPLAAAPPPPAVSPAGASSAEGGVTGRGLRIAGVALGAAGVVALGAAGAFGILTLKGVSDSKPL